MPPRVRGPNPLNPILLEPCPTQELESALAASSEAAVEAAARSERRWAALANESGVEHEQAAARLRRVLELEQVCWVWVSVGGCVWCVWEGGCGFVCVQEGGVWVCVDVGGHVWGLCVWAWVDEWVGCGRERGKGAWARGHREAGRHCFVDQEVDVGALARAEPTGCKRRSLAASSGRRCAITGSRGGWAPQNTSRGSKHLTAVCARTQHVAEHDRSRVASAAKC